MMISDAHVEAARELYKAEVEQTTVPPLRNRFESESVPDAYAIQLTGRDIRVSKGAKLIGRKVGLTSRAMQEMLNVSEPDFGYLTDQMGIANGGEIDSAELIAPRVEAEIAFRLKAPLEGDSLGVEDVLEATESVAPALEIIDSRVADWDIHLFDTVADNASCGRFVFGDWRTLDDLDLTGLEGRLSVSANGTTEESSGPGSAVLGHPATAVAWLASAISELADDHLHAGEIILPGAVSKALPLEAGSSVVAEFDELGSVSVKVAEGT